MFKKKQYKKQYFAIANALEKRERLGIAQKRMVQGARRHCSQ